MSSIRRGLLPALALAATVLLLPAAASAGETDLLFFLGQKHIDLGVSGEEDGVEEQTEVGFGVTFRGEDWPVALAVDVLFSSDDDGSRYSGTYSVYLPSYGYVDVTGEFATTVDVETSEIGFGVRKDWAATETANLYAGGGGAFVQLDARSTLSVSGSIASRGNGTTSQTLTLLDDDDSDIGYWANAGVQWRRKRLRFGIDLRYSDASAQLEDVLGFDTKIDSGGFHFGAVVGFRLGR